jgi:Mn2+/Fe2+ NRAMP family transporter
MTQSVDPEFARRVAQYQQNLKKGLVFQADGTLGGKTGGDVPRTWRGSGLRRALKFLMIAMFIKVALFHVAEVVGKNAGRDIVLDSSAIWHKAGALLLYPDAISVWVSQNLMIAQQYLAIEIRKSF